MTRASRILLPLLAVWLGGWMYVSWAAVQDDALIHLRYADHLVLRHFITYDGVHSDYGASSLLYVGLLAFLRGFTPSPNLTRATSTVVHSILFLGLACAVCFLLPKTAHVARLAGAVLLILVVMPSAVRWLDDGMETGIAVSFASLLAWLIHREFVRIEKGVKAFSTGSYFILALLAFLAVLLRTELALLCGIGVLLLAIREHTRHPAESAYKRHSHLIVGAALAFCFIVATMHHLLPDTATAKSHGLIHWFNPIRDTAVTLAGALSFGAGLFLFWILTLLLVLSWSQSRNQRTATLLANASFPLVLTLASLRGQEIQGVRYFAWTLFFSIVWNILELANAPGAYAPSNVRQSANLLGLFLVLLAIEAPFEVQAMFRILMRRSETLQRFESQHLDVLRGMRGVASDIGYVGYFTDARICDLAGLVNGRAAARLSSAERNQACLQTNPDFVFGNVGQLTALTRGTDPSRWIVCGRYDFTNIRTPDTHFIAVRPALAGEVCQATGSQPEPLTRVLAASL